MIRSHRYSRVSFAGSLPVSQGRSQARTKDVSADTCIAHTGMHKHFRMIAISEHLRNHGFDPDIYTHTRIPHIWDKLRTYYNLEVIDERENFDDEESEDIYEEFSLPRADFMEAMLQRAIASPDAASSPPELDFDDHKSSPAPKKRKRADTASARVTRQASVADTEDGIEAQSPQGRAAKGGRRGRTRAASRSKVEKAETTEEEESEEGTESESDEEEEEEESADDSGTAASRPIRGSATGGARGRGRGRGRGKRGRGR